MWVVNYTISKNVKGIIIYLFIFFYLYVDDTLD